LGIARVSEYPLFPNLTVLDNDASLTMRMLDTAGWCGDSIRFFIKENERPSAPRNSWA
jgi:hypothetical protein